MSEFKHVDKEGKEYKLSEITDSHLRNIVMRINRKSEQGLIVRTGAPAFCGSDMDYDEEVYYGKEATEFLNLDEYLEEQQRRILSEKTVGLMKEKNKLISEIADVMKDHFPLCGYEIDESDGNLFLVLKLPMNDEYMEACIAIPTLKGVSLAGLEERIKDRIFETARIAFIGE